MLNCSLENFKIIKAIGDGSCMFHAILQAFNKTYNSLDYNGKIHMVKEFRKDLSDVLTENINGKTIYDNLSRGQLKEISKSYSPVSLKNMKKDLKGNTWGDYRFLELLSEILELNIFIVDHNTKKLYETGDSELLYKKNRDYIILLNTNNIHFLLLTSTNLIYHYHNYILNNHISTLFTYKLILLP